MFKFLKKLFLKIFYRRKNKELRKLVEVQKYMDSNPRKETYKSYRDFVNYGFKK